uniref:Uncharacterized protein n=1 Tax=Anguilla anguilla TaxID=7936 RepID=A0A0E9X941_ANGAN
MCSESVQPWGQRSVRAKCRRYIKTLVGRHL